jgi:hypothetical protein
LRGDDREESSFKLLVEGCASAVHPAVAGQVEIVFVNVSVLVADGGVKRAIRNVKCLQKTDILRPQL